MTLPAIPDRCYQVPGFVEDNSLRELYEILLVRLRDEAKHLPLTTLQELLLERIATSYILIRHAEQESGYRHGRDQKDTNEFWLGMVREFNKVVEKHDAAAKNALLKSVSTVIQRALSGIDPDTADVLRERFALAFAEMDL